MLNLFQSSFVILFLAIGIHFSIAQKVSGKVLSKEDNTPIPYATISVNGGGVITNDEGDFSIDISVFKEKDSIFISFLGYKKQGILLKDFSSGVFFLEEDVVELSHVELSNEKLSLEGILEKVRENLAVNFLIASKKQNIFLRTSQKSNIVDAEVKLLKSSLLKKSVLKATNKEFEKLRSDFKATEASNFSEALGDLYTSGEKSKLSVIKVVNLTNKKNDKTADKLDMAFKNILGKYFDDESTYKVKSGLFPLEDSLKLDFRKEDELYKNDAKTKYLKSRINKIISNNNVLREDSMLDFIYKPNRYSYSLVGKIEQANDLFYKISFIPKKSAARYMGTLYVDSYDFGIKRIQYKLAPNKTGKSVNFKALAGLKLILNKWDTDIIFTKNADGKYIFKFIKQSSGNYSYVKRKLKFTRNKILKTDEKVMLKLSFLFESNNLNKEELYFINEDNINKQEFNTSKEEEHYRLEYISKYSHEIWENYNVLSPVEAIKNYK